MAPRRGAGGPRRLPIEREQRVPIRALPKQNKCSMRGAQRRPGGVRVCGRVRVCAARRLRTSGGGNRAGCGPAVRFGSQALAGSRPRRSAGVRLSTPLPQTGPGPPLGGGHGSRAAPSPASQRPCSPAGRSPRCSISFWNQDVLPNCTPQSPGRGARPAAAVLRWRRPTSVRGGRCGAAHLPQPLPSSAGPSLLLGLGQDRLLTRGCEPDLLAKWPRTPQKGSVGPGPWPSPSRPKVPWAALQLPPFWAKSHWGLGRELGGGCWALDLLPPHPQQAPAGQARGLGLGRCPHPWPFLGSCRVPFCGRCRRLASTLPIHSLQGSWARDSLIPTLAPWPGSWVS
ncbi:uncharacterized protein [Oryctolagus cuniculus]|uniref:uncharacterized protein n=1 Tax=Oryctolagus cuniculus TaxID=9986 RepID=UPI00387A0C29